MAVAAFVRFNSFVARLGIGGFNLNTDDIALYLTNATPDVANDSVKADLAEIATGNGYDGPMSLNNSYSEAGGVGTLAGDASTLMTADGGPIGPFRYAVLCDLTQSGTPLIGYWDYGAPVTVQDGDVFRFNFNDPPTNILYIGQP